MTKKNSMLIKLLSSGKSGYFFIKKKNPKLLKKKISLKKYDPVLKKHIIFNERKI